MANEDRGEQVFFAEGNIRVTSSRFIVGDQTYAMSAVSSVRAHAEQPKNLDLGCAFVLAVALVLFGFMGWVASGKMNSPGAWILAAGAALLVATLSTWRKRKPIYVVQLTTSSGEVQALTSQDWPHVHRIVEALNEAIVHRG